MNEYTLIIIFIFGLVIGSFLNMIIYRLSDPLTLYKRRSFCPHCKKIIRTRDLVPLLSYLWLRGRCRDCHNQISIRYFLLELATGLLFVLFYLKFGLGVVLFGNLVLLCFLLVIFVYDLEWKLILDQVTFPGIVLALLFSFYLGVDVLHLLLAMVVSGGFFFTQYIISKGRWVGGGDVTLGLLMGAILGWPQVLLALFLAYVLGALISLVFLGLGLVNRKSEVPFGPYLVTGTIITMLYGQEILSFYLSYILKTTF